jgi:predicted component of type VI protein secretion system
MKNINTALSLVVSALMLQACAHNSTEKQVEKEVAQETNVKTTSDLNAVQNKAIENASGINEAQKAKLAALRDSTSAKLAEYRTESLKLRAALINDIVASTDKSSEVTLIKKKLKKLQEKSLNETFSAIEKANGIMGRRAQNNSIMMNEFFEVGSHRD